MVDGALERGLLPVVTLNHFTVPRWLDEHGGWLAGDSADLFARYVTATAQVISDGVSHVVTINEPNIQALMAHRTLGTEQVVIGGPGLPEPHEPTAQALIRAHAVARQAVKAVNPDISVGGAWPTRCTSRCPAPRRSRRRTAGHARMSSSSRAAMTTSSGCSPTPAPGSRPPAQAVGSLARVAGSLRCPAALTPPTAIAASAAGMTGHF